MHVPYALRARSRKTLVNDLALTKPVAFLIALQLTLSNFRSIVRHATIEMSRHCMQYVSTQSSIKSALLKIDVRLLSFLQSLALLTRLSGYIATKQRLSLQTETLVTAELRLTKALLLKRCQSLLVLRLKLDLLIRLHSSGVLNKLELLLSQLLEFFVSMLVYLRPQLMSQSAQQLDYLTLRLQDLLTSVHCRRQSLASALTSLNSTLLEALDLCLTSTS